MTKSLAVVTLLAAAPLWSQDVFTQAVPAPAGGSANVIGWAARAGGFDAAFLHGPGIRFEGPPKKGAPYSAEAITETVQTLADGNRIRRENKAKVYRDNDGRTRREETLEAVGPWAVAGEPTTRIFINDPVAGEHWVLEPENKIARKMKIPSFGDHIGFAPFAHAEVGAAVVAPLEGAPRPAPFERRIEERHVQIQHAKATMEIQDDAEAEDLGTRMIEGVEAKGTKITRTIPAGKIGNERPIEIVFEQWRSEELGVDVLTKRSDPRAAETTYKLTNVQRTEPLPGLFQPPPDYEVKAQPDEILMRKIEVTPDEAK